jgi:hypothetical protein
MMTERSQQVSWSFATLGVAWFLGTAFMLAMIWRGATRHQESLMAHIVLLACIQAVCAWAYFGVRAEQRVSTDEETGTETAGR